MEKVFVVVGLKPLNDPYEVEYDKKVEFVGTSEDRAKEYIRNDILVGANGVKYGFRYGKYHVFAFKRYQIIEMKLNDNHSTNIIYHYIAFTINNEIIIEEDFF